MDNHPGRADFVGHADGRVEDVRPQPPAAPPRREPGLFELTPERRKLLAAAVAAFALFAGYMARQYNRAVAAREETERKMATEDRWPGR